MFITYFLSMQADNIKKVWYTIAILGLLFFVVSISQASAYWDKIIYQSPPGMYYMDTNGSNQVNFWAPSFSIWEPNSSPDGTQMVYRSAGGGWDQLLHLKNILDNSNGTTINSQWSTSPSFSADGTKIVYCAQWNGMYIKSATDTANWTGYTLSDCNTPIFSIGWTYTFDSKQSDWWKIYTRNISDGTSYAITTSGTSSKFSLSPDGTYIVYTNGSDGLCYKKILSVAGNGTAITSQSCYYPSFSTDGADIIYSSSFQIWKKSASNTANGTQLLYYTSYYGFYNGITSSINGSCGTAAGSYDYTATSESGSLCATGTPSGYSWPSMGNTSVYTCQGSGGGNDTTCSITHSQDPCKNGIQDPGELGIDYGWSCGGIYTHSGYTCENKTFSTLSWYASNNFFSNIVFSGGTLEGIQIGWTGSYVWYEYTSSDYLNQDHFEYWYQGASSSISYNSLNTLSGSTSYFQNANGKAYITAYSIRNHTEQTIGYVKFKMTASSGATMGYVDFIVKGKVISTSILQWYGAYAMAIAPIGKEGASIKIWWTKSFDFSGFDIGTITYSTVSKPQCADQGTITCTIQQQDANTFVCTPTQLGNNASVGSTCGFVDGYCQPTGIVLAPPGWNAWTNSGGTYSGSGNGIGNDFLLVFNKMQGVGTWSCDVIFSGSTFVYGNKSNSIIRSNLISHFELADTKWECNASLINVDVCGWTYDIIEGFVQSLITTFNFFVDLTTGPIRNTLGYLFEPIPGQNYCAFWDKYTWTGKTGSYYSWSSHATVNVSGLTKFDYIVIMVVVMFTFFIVFK